MNVHRRSSYRRRIQLARQLLLSTALTMTALGSFYAYFLRPQPFKHETWVKLNKVNRKNQEQIATLFHPGLAMSETHAVRFMGLPKYFHYDDDDVSQFDHDTSLLKMQTTVQAVRDSSASTLPAPILTSKLHENEHHHHHQHDHSAPESSPRRLSSTHSSDDNEGNGTEQESSGYCVCLKVRPYTDINSTLPNTVLLSKTNSEQITCVNSNVVVKDDVSHTMSPSSLLSSQAIASAEQAPPSPPPPPVITNSSTVHSSDSKPLGHMQRASSTSSLSLLDSAIQSPILTSVPESTSHKGKAADKEVEVLTDRSSLLMYNVTVVRPVDISYTSDPIPFPLKCTRWVMGAVHRVILQCPSPWEYSYYLRLDTLNIAQDLDLQNAVQEFRRFIDYYEPLGKKLVLGGSSRGAAVTFSLLAVIQRDDPELHQRVIRNVKLIILDSCFDTVTHTLEQKWGYYLTKVFEPIIETFSSYRRDGSSPLSLVPYFPHEIPILFVTSKIDTTVPMPCTISLRDAIAKHRFDAIQDYLQSAHVELDTSEPGKDATTVVLPVKGTKDEFITHSLDANTPLRARSVALSDTKQEDTNDSHPAAQDVVASAASMADTSDESKHEQQVTTVSPVQPPPTIAPIHTLVLNRSKHRGYSVDNEVDALRYKQAVEAMYERYI